MKNIIVISVAIISLCVSLFVLNCEAQPVWQNPPPQVQWQRQNQFTYKGYVNDIVHFNMQKVVAAGDSGQVLISYDGCASIKNVNTVYNNSFKSLSFVNEQTGFVCGSNGIIIKTVNGGVNWTQLNTGGATETFFGIQALNSSLIVAVGELGKIIKSTNGGTNWAVKNSDNSCYLLSVKFFNQNTGVAVGWPGVIYRTTNSGDTWNKVYHNINFTAQFTSVDTRNNTAYAVGDLMIIIRSTDYGLNWVKADTITGAPLYKVKILDSLKIIAVGDQKRLSFDGGQTFSYYGAWVNYGSYLVSERGLALNTIDTGYVCGNTGIGKPQYYLSSLYLLDYPYNIYDLHVISVADGSNCWVLGRGFFAHNLPHIVFNTTNGGTDWVFQSIYNTVPNALTGVLFFNTYTGYVSGDDGGNGFLLKTTDKGMTWSQSCYGNAGQFSGTLKKFRNRLYTYNNLGYIIYTTNGGQNWSNVSMPPSTGFSGFSVADSNLYFGYNSNSANNLFKSSNGGQNWVFLTNPLTGRSWYEMNFFNENTGFLVGDKSSIIKTTNGNTFVASPTGSTNTNLIFNSVCMADSVNVFVVGDSGIIYKSTNCGTNWNPQNSGLKDDLYRVRFYDRNTGWIVGINGVILHTTTGGTVWVSNNGSTVISDYHLFQNFPNPFNPITNVKFSMYNAGVAKLVVYDVQGREVQTLVNERLNAGTYEVKFDGSMLNSGVYFYKLITDVYSETKKMVLIK